MTSKIRGLLGKFGLVVGSLVVTLLLAEIAGRLLGLAPAGAGAGGDSVQSVLEFDDKLETRYQPNSHTRIQSQYREFAIDYSFNELGLRDRPLPPRSEDRSCRVLALGNSFVEGWGVQAEDSFLRVAEERLNAGRSGSSRSFRLINAGASGYGVAQCYLLCKELLAKTMPDAVVFFYLPTMLPADVKFLSKADLDSQGVAVGLNLDALLKASSPVSPRESGNAFVDSTLVARLAESSCLVHFVRSRVANRVAQQSIVPGDPRSDLLAAYRAPVDQLGDMHEPTLRHLGALAGLARERGLPFLVVQLPMPFEISSLEWERGRRIYGLPSETPVCRELTDRPAESCRARGVPYFLASDFLAKKAAHQAGDPRIYFSFDFHLNKHGQQLLGGWLADTLARALEERSVR